MARRIGSRWLTLIFRRKTRIAVRMEEGVTCRTQTPGPEGWCQCCESRGLFILREVARCWANQAELRAGKTDQCRHKEEK
jgi:hypothetical protein